MVIYHYNELLVNPLNYRYVISGAYKIYTICRLLSIKLALVLGMLFDDLSGLIR